MEIITVTRENIEQEHICCAIASNKDIQVQSKKAWLSERMDEGLVFLKGNMRGKCFIEYIPAEYAWIPIEANNYMYINCFWIAGQFKGQGYSNELLDACVKDSKSKGKLGICVISSPKKMPYLSDPKYLTYKGFEVADTAEPYFTLMYLPFEKDALKPKFRDQVKQPHIQKDGFVLYYTNGCPFNAKYVPLIEKAANEAGIAFQSMYIDSLEKAQVAPVAWTNFGLFYNGKYVTNEILSDKKFLKLADQLILSDK